MENNNQTKWYEMVLSMLIAAGIILLGGWGITSCVKHDNEQERQQVINNQSNTVYSFQHPEIVGTNENGEVVKRYYDYTTYRGATIYEIGKTKTTVISHGKFGTTTDVSVEQP